MIGIIYDKGHIQVGPRDGLQNEKTLVPTDVKVEFIRYRGLVRKSGKVVLISVDWQRQG